MLYVNNEKIEQSDIDAEIRRLRPEYEKVFFADTDDEAAEYDRQLADWSRQNVIERVIFTQAARREITDVTDDDIRKEYDDLIAKHGTKERLFESVGLSPDDEQSLLLDISDQLKVARLTERITSDAPLPTEERIRKYYDENIDRFTTAPTVCASHIVKYLTPNCNPTQIEQQMNDILWQVRNNNNFDELALKQSDCPERAGDLGCFPKGRMVPEFEDVVFAMEPGDISDVFRTPFGFHIARVTDKHPESVAAFDSVRQTIRDELVEGSKQHQLEMFVDAEKEKALIEIRQD